MFLYFHIPTNCHFWWKVHWNLYIQYELLWTYASKFLSRWKFFLFLFLHIREWSFTMDFTQKALEYNDLIFNWWFSLRLCNMIVSIALWNNFHLKLMKNLKFANLLSKDPKVHQIQKKSAQHRAIDSNF